MDVNKLELDWLCPAGDHKWLVEEHKYNPQTVFGPFDRINIQVNVGGKAFQRVAHTFP